MSAAEFCLLTLLWFTTLLSTTHTSTDLGLEAYHHVHQEAGLLEKLDLLEAVGLFGNVGNFSVRHHGVVLRPGPHSSSPAAFFMSSLPAEKNNALRRIKVDLKSHPRLQALFSSQKATTDLALMASVKQAQGNSGTLLSLGLGAQRLFEIQSSGRNSQLRFIYRASSSDGGVDLIQAVETVSVNLADNQWHKLAVTLSGNQLQVFLDCQSIQRRIIRPLDFRISSPIGEELSLWIGQQSEQRFLYKGFIQNFYLVTGQNGHSLQCPTMDLACPTCGEFRHLQQTVQALQDQYMKQIELLSQRLEATEARLSKVEECDCHKSCRLPGGIVREDGASWSDSNQCQLCSCVRGVVTCRPPTCPTLNCTDPNPPDPSRGICCPSCKAECRDQISGSVFLHGETIQPRRCVTCQCDNGHLNCSRKNPAVHCPLLTCPESEQILEEGQCCKTCKHDFCSRGHDCHPELATCVNGLQNYTCHCKPGFKGDGKLCEDHDECEELGDGSTNHGHFCTQPNSICVNTLGSYKCECEEGYHSNPAEPSRLTCSAINNCLNSSRCHANATCQFLGPGKHQCSCNPGYSGDGSTTCSPICEAGCENGGQCSGPDQCTCPSGFEGPRCQFDIDECSMGPTVHKCSQDSTCVNKPGWHYCQCNPGFRAYQDPSLDGATICIDENECEMGTHTCHSSAQCWNTAGSFQCYCGANSDATCSTECLVDGVSHPDGSQWVDECNNCKCQNGVVSCQPTSCQNCSTNSANNLKCCPQCSNSEGNEPFSKCLSQGQDEYNHGQKWLSQCQECECMNGEIDCWPMECPPTFCSHPILRPGHCCPSCLIEEEEEDNSGGLLCNSSSCLHFGREYRSGQSWILPDPTGRNCSSCNCRVPICDSRVSRAAAAHAFLANSFARGAACKKSSFAFYWMALYFALLALHASRTWTICLPLMTTKKKIEL